MKNLAKGRIKMKKVHVVMCSALLLLFCTQSSSAKLGVNWKWRLPRGQPSCQ
jgi:hypothetical protein